MPKCNSFPPGLDVFQGERFPVINTILKRLAAGYVAPMSALPLKADVGNHSSDVRFVPKADVSSVWKVRLKYVVSRHRAANPL